MSAADRLALETLVGRIMRLARELPAGGINDGQAKAYAAELAHEFEAEGVEGASTQIAYIRSNLTGRSEAHSALRAALIEADRVLKRLPRGAARPVTPATPPASPPPVAQPKQSPIGRRAQRAVAREEHAGDRQQLGLFPNPRVRS